MSTGENARLEMSESAWALTLAMHPPAERIQVGHLPSGLSFCAGKWKDVIFALLLLQFSRVVGR